MLLVDELDASLHSRFAAEVVRLFQAPWVNPKGAQLVFTGRDPSLLRTPGGGRLLQPGQIGLTEKDERGATELSAVAEWEPTEEEDLMASYLAGSSGAVPKVSDAARAPSPPVGPDRLTDRSEIRARAPGAYAAGHGHTGQRGDVPFE